MASTLQPPISAAPGINGTICPPRTPWHLDTDHADYIGKMAPQGASMGNKSYTNDDFVKAYAAADAKSPKGKAIVFYDPGTLTGYGGGATSTPALQKVGRAGRESNVLFYPAKGVGPDLSLLIVGKSPRFYDMRSVTIAGIIGGRDEEFGFLESGVQDFYLWRCVGAFFNGNAVAGMPMKNFGYVECAKTKTRLVNADAAAFRAVVDGPFSGLVLWHNFIDANYRFAKSATHTDTVQLSGNASYGDVDDWGNVMICSQNQAFIIGGAYNVRMRGGVKIAGTRGFVYSPVPEGGDLTTEQNWPVNGGGVVGGTTVEDETWIGSAKGVFEGLAKVVNTTISIRSTATDKWPGFKLDSSLNNLTRAQLYARWPRPSMASLMALWNTGAIVIPDPPQEPPTEDRPLPGDDDFILIYKPLPNEAVKELVAFEAYCEYERGADDSGLQGMRVFIEGWPNLYGPLARVPGPFSATWRGNLNLSTLPDGTYTYGVEATPWPVYGDPNKYTKYGTLRIVNGALPPKPGDPTFVTVTKPAVDATVRDSITIEATAEYERGADQSGIQSARILVGGSVVASMAYVPGPLSATWRAVNIDTKKFPNGKYTYTVEMTPWPLYKDTRKFTRTGSLTIANGSIVAPPAVDQTKPVATIARPTHAGAILSGEVLIWADATDEAAMDRVELYATGKEGEVRVGPDFLATTPPRYALSTNANSFPDGIPMPEGDQVSIRVKAIDAAGNEGFSDPRVVFIKRPDNEPPVVNLTSPTPGFILTPGAPLHLEGTATDRTDVQLFEFRDQDGNVLALGAGTTDSNVYSADITTPDDLFTIEAYAEDQNRNGSSSAAIPVVYVPREDVPDEEVGFTTLVWSANLGGVDGLDENLLPDETFASGSVVITPTADYVKLPGIQVPRTIILGQANVPLVNGVLRGPDGSAGVRIASLYDDPRFQPTGLQWRVSFIIEGKPAGALPDIYINARLGETIDLSQALSAAVQPGTVTVVSHEDRLAVEAMTAQVRSDMLQIESRLTAGTMYWLLDVDNVPFWFIAAQEPPGALVWELDAEGRPYWTKKEESE